jgi:hypothetical protein
MKKLAILKILPETPFKDILSAFRRPPMTLKIVPKAACDSENCSESLQRHAHFCGFFLHPMWREHLRNLPMTEGKLKQKFGFSFWNNLRI